MNVLLFKPGTDRSFYYKDIEGVKIEGSILTFHRAKPNGTKVKVITSLPFKLQEEDD